MALFLAGNLPPHAFVVQLAVRDLDGGTEHILLSPEQALGFSLELGLGLDWAENDTIYAARSRSSGVLLSLGVE